MRDGDVEIGWLPEARISELQAFLESEWKSGHILARDEQLLRWQHARGADELAIAVASSRGALVGILGVIPTTVGICDRREGGAWLTTWAVTPAWRQRQVGLRLLEFVSDQHEFVGTVGGNETTLRILGALGFHVMRAIPRWILPLSEEGCARLLGTEHVSLAERRITARPLDSAVVHEWSPDDDAPWDEAWRLRLAPQLAGTWRDAAYIRWRYLQHPRFRYRVLIAVGEDGAPAGLLVYRVQSVHEARTEVLRVVEAMGEINAVERLACHLVDDARDSDVALADFYCTSSRFTAGLERAGFMREHALPLPFPDRFQPLERATRALTGAFRFRSVLAADLFAGDHAYFTRSDGDQDRPN